METLLRTRHYRSLYTGTTMLELITGLLIQHRYTVMVPAAFIFGAPVGLVAGFLLRFDVVELVPTVLALAGGELAADILWYWLGIRYGDAFTMRYGRYIGISQKGIVYAKDLFNRHHDIVIFTSKLTAGFGFGTAIMFTAGLSKVPFRRYMMLNVAGQFFWTSGLLSIGYFLGHLIGHVNNIFEGLALFALVVIVALSFFGFSRYLKSEITS